MSAAAKIKTRCPVCHTAYQVPNSTVGHRARCPKCDSVFRVMVPKLPDDPLRPHPPTEDDILKWLSEGAEREDDLPPAPRRWHEPPPAAHAPGSEPDASKSDPHAGQHAHK